MQVFNEPLENARAHLLSIYEKERRIEKEEEFVKHPEEYQQIQMELWDYCDTLPLSTVESAIVELTGENMGFNSFLESYDKDISISRIEEVKRDITKRKRIITDLEDYLKARLETGEMSEE